MNIWIKYSKILTLLNKFEIINEYNNIIKYNNLGTYKYIYK